MKKIFALFFVSSCFLGVSLGQSEPLNELDSGNMTTNADNLKDNRVDSSNFLAVTDISLYQGTAFITKTGKVHVVNNEIVVSNLPAKISRDYLTIKLNNQIVSNYRLTKKVLNIDVDTTKIDEVKKKIDDLNDQIDKNADKISVLKHQIKVFESIYTSILLPIPLTDSSKSNSSIDQNRVFSITSSLTVKEVMDGMALVTDKNMQLYESVSKLEITNRDLKRQLEKLNHIVNSPKPKATKNYDDFVNLTIPVIADRSTDNRTREASLTITYMLDGASWVAQYKANLNTTTNKVDFSFDAAISQNTGEDWQGVNLTIFNGVPAQYIPLYPIKDSWVIGLPKKVSKANSNENNLLLYKSSAAASVDRASDSSLKLATAEYNQSSSVVYTGLDAKFVVNGKISINSGALNQIVNVATLNDLSSEIIRKYLPEQDENQVHLLADVKNSGGFVWYEGSLVLSRDSVYLGKTSITRTLPDSKLELDFGADPFITVKTMNDPQFESESGLFNKRRVVKRSKVFTIQNNYEKPVKVLTLAKLPVANDENIDVELYKSSSKPTKFDVYKIKGLLGWENTVKAKSTDTINFSYQVSYPQDVPYLEGL